MYCADKPYLPEPDNDVISGSVAIGIDCVPSPVIHIDLCQTTQQVLDGGGGGGGGGRGRGEEGRGEGGGGGVGGEGDDGGGATSTSTQNKLIHCYNHEYIIGRQSTFWKSPK